MRGRYPDGEGYLDRDGVSIFYEVYENEGPTVVLVPTTTIWNSRQWKMQIPYLSRHFRVVTFDGRGNGKSGHPKALELYRTPVLVDDIRAVMDETETDQAILVALCHAVPWILDLATSAPDLVTALVAISPHVDHIAPAHDHWVQSAENWDQVRVTYEGWEMANKHYWLSNYPTWLQFFFNELVSEPHSTKAIEDAVSWGLGTTGAIRVNELAARAVDALIPEEALDMCRAVAQPVLVIHGTDDQCQPVTKGRALAELTGGTLIEIEGGGHGLMGREPVKVNRAIEAFIEEVRGLSYA